MSEIIDFKSRGTIGKDLEQDLDIDTITNPCEEVLKILHQSADSIADMYIFFKNHDNEWMILDTDLDIVDKALLVQLLQHDVLDGLTSDDNDLELDL